MGSWPTSPTRSATASSATVTGALLLRAGAARRARSRAQVGRLVEAQQDRMARLRDSVNAANRRSLILTGVFAVSAVLFALLCGFVISWSFILPVREAQGFLDEGGGGQLRRPHQRLPTATNSARSPTG